MIQNKHRHLNISFTSSTVIGFSFRPSKIITRIDIAQSLPEFKVFIYELHILNLNINKRHCNIF